MSKVMDYALPEEYLQLSKDILMSLHFKNITVSDDFVLMIVRVVSLDPENKFILKQFLEPTEVDRIKRVTIERVLSMTSLARQILMLQLHYRRHFLTRDELLQIEHGEMEKQLKVNLDELCTAGVPTQKKHRELFYHKLISAIITRTGISIGKNWGLGNEYNLIQQTKTAFTTIFPIEDIDLLNKFGPDDRELEIRSLIDIALGIRILNKHVDPENAGAGLPDLGKQLTEKVTAALKTLNDLRNRNLTRLVYYTTLIKPFFINPDLIKRPGRRGITKDMLLIRQGLTMVHQLLNYIRILDQELGDEEALGQSIIKNFDQAVTDLSKIVVQSRRIPTFTIFPKFTELGNIWHGMRDSLGFVSNCGDLLIALDEFTEESLQYVDGIVNSTLSEDILIPTVEEFLAQAAAPEEQPFISAPGALARRSTFTGNDVIYPDTQYSGFCVWSLVEGLGMLQFSNPLLGLFHWNEKKFLLSTGDAATAFARDPETYIHKAIHIALKWPELIYILKMEDEVFQPEITAEAIRETPAPKTYIYADVEIQTELHPVSSNIVEGYSWNEWDYRRRALILSNVHKSVTHSTQTYIQSINLSEGTQTYPLRNHRVQTTRSVYTEAPRSQFYFFGLRGHHCNAQGPQPPHIVELSRESVMEMTKVKFPTPAPISLHEALTPPPPPPPPPPPAEPFPAPTK